jgi:adenylosuccinate lyase
MPLPARYQIAVPGVVEIWEPAGYFKAQMGIWKAICEASSELNSQPTSDELTQIKNALTLTPEEVSELSAPTGHETNKLLRKIQSKLSDNVGNYIHRGNTSSDVLDTSIALQSIESLKLIESVLSELRKSLIDLAIKHKNTLQIARTHGQHAVPQTFGRQVLGWAEGVNRCVERTKRAQEVIAYGKLSGEVGTNVFITPELEELALEKLGLKTDSAPTQVIGRDRHLEMLLLMTVNARWLGKIANDLRMLCMTDIGEVREPFEEEKQGSSAMPHKRNPDGLERVLGLTRIVAGASEAESESVELLFERDISHSSVERFSLPDSFGALLYAVQITKKIIDGLEVFPDKMTENLQRTFGSIYSSRLLNTLLDKNAYSRTDGYDIVKNLAQKAIDSKTHLLELAKNDPRVAAHFQDGELEEQFDPAFYLQNIDVAFKRAGIV